MSSTDSPVGVIDRAKCISLTTFDPDGAPTTADAS